jgi:methionyl-tRNA formyltransferase
LKGISKYRTAIINIGNRSETIDYLESNNVDLMVVNVWAILPEEIISLPKFGTVNIHPSKLPQYCGALPTLWSLKNGDKESALTYQIMDKAIDAGAIIGQHSFAISEVDDWISVEAIINEILQANFLSDLKGYIAGEIKPVAQNMQIRSNTDKYYEYMEIDWDKENCKDIYNKINLYPYFAPDEFCYTFLSGKKIEIKKADFINSRFALTKLGQYYVQGLTLFIQAKVGVITCKLFSGVRIKDSFLFILKRKGDFIR